MKRIVMGMVLAILSSQVCAAGWTPPLTITSAFVEDSDLIVVYTADSSAYTSGCGIGAWIFNTSSDARRGRVWATVLTAIAGGNKVSLWFGDSCTTWNFHAFTAIKIIPQ
jgi:hypothetical protein